jgi:hypothetical protein
MGSDDWNVIYCTALSSQTVSQTLPPLYVPSLAATAGWLTTGPLKLKLVFRKILLCIMLPAVVILNTTIDPSIYYGIFYIIYYINELFIDCI